MLYPFTPETTATRLRVPNDNSCLFYAVAYLCDESLDETAATTAAKATELRGVCRDAAAADPDPETRALMMFGFVGTGPCKWYGGERAAMYNTVYLERRGGNCLRVTNGHDGLSDVMVLAGAPIGAPVVASGTMVMNSDAQVQQAMYDYQRGTFGPWDHRVDDEEWAAACDARHASGVVR